MTRLARNLAAITLAAACAGLAFAHEGHHHDEEEAPVVSGADGMVTAAPTVTFSTPKLELVLSRTASQLLIYIDDYATNAPLPGLNVSAQAGGRDVGAESVAPGTYALPLDLLPVEPDAPLRLRIRGKANDLALDEVIESRLPPAVAAAGSQQGKGR